MDTDDLSDKTYRAILSEAESFNHDLTLQFGLLSYECKNEKEYIEKSLELVAAIRNADDFAIEAIFFGNPPTRKKLNTVLDKIEKNIRSLV